MRNHELFVSNPDKTPVYFGQCHIYLLVITTPTHQKVTFRILFRSPEILFYFTAVEINQIDLFMCSKRRYHQSHHLNFTDGSEST